MALQNNRSLGQNWLKNRVILDEIAELTHGDDLDFLLEDAHASDVAASGAHASNATDDRLCLEIGPGLGTLTSSLLRIFPKVLAIELDPQLAKNLPKSFPGKNLEIVNQDFLKFDLESIKQPYVVAGNIPYYITSPIVRKLVKTTNKPERIVLLIQKEVAERIAAKVGKHTVLSLMVQNYAKVLLGPVVPRTEFTPAPKVDSQAIILEPLPAPIIPEQTFALIKRGFSAPRKKLIRNLGQVSKENLKNAFARLNISPDARPADLSLDDWQKLDTFFSCQSQA